MVKSIQTLVAVWEEATRQRKLSTLLFEDPDAVVAQTPDEKKLLAQLNEQVSTNPEYPIPDGYLKVKERVPVFDYSVPKAS